MVEFKLGRKMIMYLLDDCYEVEKEKKKKKVKKKDRKKLKRIEKRKKKEYGIMLC